jgi:hypothetical protein
MSLKEQHTEPKRCQCVYPDDCGEGGCAGGLCGPQVSATDLVSHHLLDHTRIASNELTSTCCDPCEKVHFDFGNGYNWLVSAWPYITDCDGPPVYVVLPPRQPLRFCLEGEAGSCGGGGAYVYKPGCCCQCPTTPAGTAGGGDELRYRLDYDRALDEFVMSDGEGSFWRFIGFKPNRIERGRFKSFQSHQCCTSQNVCRFWSGME